MTAPQTGGPPETEKPAPARNRLPAHLTNSAEFSRYVTETRRRRSASRRIAILESGRSDPWHYDEVPLTEHQREAWQRTVAHLTAAGFRPILPADVEGLR